ncbi:MAG: zf-HC2 domain-containing protein [Candidatus Omnitrophota bacterium]
MNCKEIQEIIITDYLDNEISEGLRKEITLHLSACSECKRFEEAMRKTAVEPLKQAEKKNAPKALWYNIKDKIESAPKPAFFHMPRPAFAAAAILTVLIIAFSFIMRLSVRHDTAEVYLQEQAQFLVSLTSGNGNTNDYEEQDNENLSSAVEEYFL